MKNKNQVGGGGGEDKVNEVDKDGGSEGE